jgi:hypothetical protein
VFTAFRSTNGVDWVAFAWLTNDISASGLLGLNGWSQDNNPGKTTTIWFRNYSDIGPALLAQPMSQSVTSSVTVVFGVAARGLPPLQYQWLFNGAPLAGATSNLLTLSAVSTSHAGDYRVLVTNPHGAITSQVATLTVDGLGGGGGFEADVAPRPFGSQAVSVSDWTQVGRFVAGLDTVLNSSEFRRADCAPRASRGNGVLSVADWSQAGRYAAGLDPLTPAGGPDASSGGGGSAALQAKDGAESRLLRVGDTKAALGQDVLVPIWLLAQGNENAVGFSLRFDPARLAFRSVALGEGAPGAMLQVNAAQAERGRLGVVLARSAGEAWPAGEAALVRVRFTALGESGFTPVNLADVPVPREVASVSAEALGVASRDGRVQFVQPGRLSPRVRLAGGVAELSLTGEAGEAYRVEVSSDLVKWSSLSTHTAGAEPLSVLDPAAGPHRQRFYRVVLQP